MVIKRMTDEEIYEAGMYHSNPMSVKREIAKASYLKAIRQIRDWGDEKCYGHPAIKDKLYYILKHECSVCWKQFIAELAELEKE